MKPGIKLIGTGILTALAASLCCITPILALVAGTSGMATTFSWLEPFRPYLIASTLLILGFAWYQNLKRRKAVECDCDSREKSNFLQSTTFLGLVTVFTIGMLSLPLYGGVFSPNQKNQIAVIDQSNSSLVEFTVKGMTCSGCENHINHEVNKLEGIIQVRASYEEGNTVVEFDPDLTAPSTIKKAINSTGYEVITTKKE